MHLRIVLAATFAAITLAFGPCDEGDDDAGNPTSELSSEEATAPLESAPPELKSVRDEANQLLGGGVDGFDERLGELQGTPVVVNNWASWCGPCRAEFPFFQEQAVERGDEVAFLGVVSDDSEAAAETFLTELPLPYPSYLDPDNDIKDEFLDHPVGLPNTAFYDSRGDLAYVHQGPYTDEAQLAAEIDKYAQ